MTVRWRGCRWRRASGEPASFWTYVVTALDTAAPGVGTTALSLLQGAHPPIETVLATVLNELGALPAGLDLVLDDYHLADGPAIATDLAFLVEHLPPDVRLVISTRADPDLPLARLRARGELVEVRAADLRFTPDEVAAYLNEVIGLDLDAADITALEGRTEGWIAALQLAALSLQGRDDAAGFIAGFAGDDRYVVDYLVEEVLARQPDAVRRFLLQTSILDRLSGPLCDAVTDAERRQGRARAARPLQHVPRPPRRQPALVPLPPPVRRRPAHAPGQGAARRRERPAPPGRPVVRRGRGAGGRRPAHAGRR